MSYSRSIDFRQKIYVSPFCQVNHLQNNEHYIICIEFIQTERKKQTETQRMNETMKETRHSSFTQSLTEMKADSEDDDFITHSVGAWQAFHIHNHKKNSSRNNNNTGTSSNYYNYYYLFVWPRSALKPMRANKQQMEPL